MDVEELGSSDVDAAVALWQLTDLTRPWNDAHTDFRPCGDGSVVHRAGVAGSQ